MSGWNDADECSDDRKGQLWSSHSFFETMNKDQINNSLCRGDDDAATFSGIEVDPGESLLTQLHRVDSSTFVRFESPKRLSSTSLDSNRGSSLATTKQWALEAKPSGDALRNGRRQWHSEVHRG